MDVLYGESPVEDLRRWLADPPRSFDEEDHGRLFKLALGGHNEKRNPRFPLAVRKEIIEMLLPLGINPVADGETPLFVCATAEEAAMLLDGGVPIDAREEGPMGDTALLHHTELLVTQHKQGLVVLTTRFNLIRFLVSRGADLGARDAFMKTSGNIAENFVREIEMYFPKDLIPGGLFATCADFLEAVRVAGSYKAYARAPRIELARLRLLCARA